jgi:uncharacterized delta-60 repeat protein
MPCSHISLAPRLTLVGAVAFVIAIANPAAAPPGDLDPTFDGDGKVTTDFAGGIEEAFGFGLQGDGKIVAAGIALGSGSGDFALARYNSDGSPDTTFDTDGKVTTDFSGSGAQASAVVIQGDGKIVAAGGAFVWTSDIALARYKADGSLDTIFSGDGKVTTDFAGMDDNAWAVAIQANGMIVAAGLTRVDVSGIDDFAVARYTCLRRTSRPTSIPVCP